MRIGILGSGQMADALGTQWRRAGHEVRTGGRSGGLREAAEFGTDAVLLALPYAAVAEVVGGLGEALRARALIDCTNPVGAGFRLLTAGGPAGAERIAAAAPDAHVVKAFNLCHVDVWRLTPPVFDGRPLAVPLCGDDPAALDVVRQLVRDLGCEPLNAGGLDRAGLVEATAALLIGLWVGEGADAQAIAPPLAHAAGY
ncbi:NAD(P)-binding domain-containing protein [Streptomyces phaeoluteigriseus]|uniref:NAD(P)-binding domain-containing protein n=1 Tax=Streptomyces phaeoluteigriseus TaxID=114686 RepID=A0ABY4Z492_9ACTN|nr:NAD(P)-binding domain-containing protein [Streptomyces phaeoluteigriseus]USQ83770.1 NAD(P)-binding domain-containing protein [Streptomyces phaeoluteigriseus]